MKDTIKKNISNAWTYALFLIIMILIISIKKDYHMDEIYSYGLANNVGYTSIHPVWAPYTYENPADVYLDYMIIEDGEGFDIANCWYNQERESSPPFYYLAVHMVSAVVAMLAGERFTRWTAASVNLVFMLMALYMFRKLLKLYRVKGKELNLFSLYFIVSPAILNAVSFLRMYCMVIFFAMLITYLILKYRNHENFKFYIFMILASVGAVLTQYYMIFYLFFISLMYGIYLLWKKEWLKAGKYILSMGIAGALTYLIFPGIIFHLFIAGRGTEGIDNLTGGFELYGEYLGKYWEIINKQLFGNLFIVLIIVAAVLLVYRYIKKRSDIDIQTDLTDVTLEESIWDICIGVLPLIFYVLIIAKIAPYQTDRYIMAIYGAGTVYLLLAIRYLVNKCLTNKEKVKNLIVGAVCVVLLLAVYKDFNWSYLFLDMEEHLETMESYSDVDGLCVISDGWRVTGNFNEIIKLDTMTFFQGDISTLADMDELKQKDEFILYVADYDAEKIIQQIYEICPQINASEYINKSDAAHIYHLYSSK